MVATTGRGGAASGGGVRVRDSGDRGGVAGRW